MKRAGRIARIKCRLFGHSVWAHRTVGGWPEQFFTIKARCRRCGEDRSVTVPSAFTIFGRAWP